MSGHSTFSGAGAKVLQQFTGSDLFGARDARPGSSFVEPGANSLPTILTWPTFSAARDEAAGVSRRLGGIHFPDADHHGRTSAPRSASRPAKAQTYFTGTAGGQPPHARLVAPRGPLTFQQATARQRPPPGGGRRHSRT